MIANGHPPETVFSYTPEQINLFTEVAIERRNLELLSAANVHAVGAASAFSGSSKPLDAFEKAIRGKVTAKGMRGELQDRLKKLAAQTGKLKVKDHGANRR